MLGKRVTKVSCGSSHTAALTSTGELWTWGSSTGTPTAPTDVPTRLLVFDSSDYPPEQFSLQLSRSRVVDVACGYGHTLIRLASGELQTFGDTAETHLKLKGYSNDQLPEGLLRRPQVVDDCT